MHTRTRMALMAAMAAGIMGSAYARTITVTENKDANGLTTSFNLAFSSDSATHSLWMAWGDSDGGTASIADWENSKPIGLVPGDMTAWPYAVPVPAGWGQTASRLRFVLIEGAGVPGAETLEYVEATGSQYVMTGFTPTRASAVEMSFAFTSSTGWQNLFCARGSSGTQNTFTLLRNGGASWRWDFGNGASAQQYGSFDPGSTKHSLRADSSGLTINTTSVASASAANFTAGSTLSIFASHLAGSSWGNYGHFKLYSFKAWADGSDASTIKLDLTPCRKTDGTVCLYNWADGTFIEVAAESQALVASATVVAPAASVIPAASSGLVTAAMQGWETTGGAFYSYINPVYVVDVAAGTSNAINEVTFKRMAVNGGSVTTDVSYAAFTASAMTGTIIKRGGGTLTFDQDLSTFTGPVHVEDGVAIGVCSNCFGHTTYAGQGENQRTYVHVGATLVMDAIGNEPLRPEANAIYYEGDGYPGMGGALVMRNGDSAETNNQKWSRWQPGAKSRTVGPASLYVDTLPGGSGVSLASGAGEIPSSDFSLAGQELLLHGRGVESQLLVNNVSVANIGDLVISNVTLKLSNAGYLSPANGTNSTIRFRGGARWVWSPGYTGSGQTATVYVDDMEYASVGTISNGRGVDPWDAEGKKYYWYNGPVVLNGDFRTFNSVDYYSAYNYSQGCTFESEVSGSGGFRPYYDEQNRNRANGARLNLLYPTNTFNGGIVLASGSLGVYGEKAVPSHEGAGTVSVTNGYVYFGRKVATAGVTNNWVDFTMPVTEFVNGGAVTNGTGLFKGLVKKGTGTLDYNSQMGGDYLDVQSGTVKFNTQYRGAYTSESAPAGYEPMLPAFTTLKGTAGVLDLGGENWTVANVEGSPTVTNGNLAVTGAWTVDAATAGANPATVYGTLSFGAGATVTVSGDLDAAPHPGGILLANATAITGTPRLVNASGWTLSTGAGELRLVSNKPTVLSFR